MSEPPQPPGAARPGDAGLGRPSGAGPVWPVEVRPVEARPGYVRPLDLRPAAVGAALAVAAGTALLGLAAGYAWSQLAPRALLVMVSPGAAGLVQAETSAFIAADASFCLITLTGGVLSGALGYLLAVRRHGPLAMAGVLAGAVAAAYLTRWVGEQSGLAAFQHQLATLPAGARLRDALTLRATGALAFWPLAAGLTAAGMEAFGTRGRHRGAPRPARRAVTEG